MSDLDLNKITLEELTNNPSKDLLAFQDKLHKAIEIRRETERVEIYESVQALISNSGFTLTELFPVPSEKNIKIATAKIKFSVILIFPS